MRLLASVFNALAVVVLLVALAVAGLNGLRMQSLRQAETTEAAREAMESATVLTVYGAAGLLFGAPILFLCGGVAGHIWRSDQMR